MLSRPSVMKYPSKHLLIFFAMAFAWSWACWLLAPIVKTDSTYASNALFFLGGFGPIVAAVLVVAATGGRSDLRIWLKRCLHWRGHWGWVTLAFLSPLAVLTVAASAHMALDGSVPLSPVVNQFRLDNSPPVSGIPA